MEDFYQHNYFAYHKKTFHIDPSSFLAPLIRHLKPDASILDVGCGSGRDLLWLKKSGFKVTGFERSEGLADLARKYAGCKIIVGDFDVYDFSKQTFDAVLLCGSLVHIPHARLESVFGNIIKGVGVGGNVLVSLKEGVGSSTAEDGRTFHFWQSYDLGNIFSKNGLRILDFQRNTSKVNSMDTWLSYVLTRE